MPPALAGTMPTLRISIESESFSVPPAIHGQPANHQDVVSQTVKYWERPVLQAETPVSNYRMIERPLAYFVAEPPISEQFPREPLALIERPLAYFVAEPPISEQIPREPIALDLEDMYI